MEAIRRYLKVQLPRYLKGLPLPRTFAGFAKLKQDEWMYLAPLLITIGVLIFSLFFSGKSQKPARLQRINHTIKLDKEKVVNTVKIPDVEELCDKNGGKCVMCRCWKSKKFPYCDGSHTKHNKETGDNVGPLIVQK
ncbi:TPA: hypothetical protein N0F65_003439 [Lagenidium giganteum]|uniref:Iron-binding zinc finger CDGSH type domain-containing protein n=1 Tax=Lagenidium giganteum TaxID=4803 RepID=A0AAV2YK23_9STRA|nr:TPA: hypothetical protein N0F65_003439 [Lagenidium giganteum]